VEPLTANRGLPFVVRLPNLDLKVSLLQHIPRQINLTKFLRELGRRENDERRQCVFTLKNLGLSDLKARRLCIYDRRRSHAEVLS